MILTLTLVVQNKLLDNFGKEKFIAELGDTLRRAIGEHSVTHVDHASVIVYGNHVVVEVE